MNGTELVRVAAEQDWPRLRVHRLSEPSRLLRHRWAWEITDPGGRRLDGAVAPSWAQALTVGLAALDVATRPVPAWPWA